MTTQEDRKATSTGHSVQELTPKYAVIRSSGETVFSVVAESGRQEWFFVIECNVLHARRFGRYASKADAEATLKGLAEQLIAFLDCDSGCGYPVVEDELGMAYRTKRGRRVH